MHYARLRFLLLSAAIAFTPACGGGDDDGADASAPGIDAAVPDAAAPDGGAACGPTELCTRSINECGVALTLEQCEAWYADPASCADINGYTACNCQCIDELTCTEYFDCGQICFENWC